MVTVQTRIKREVIVGLRLSEPQNQLGIGVISGERRVPPCMARSNGRRANVWGADVRDLAYKCYAKFAHVSEAVFIIPIPEQHCLENASQSALISWTEF